MTHRAGLLFAVELMGELSLSVGRLESGGRNAASFTQVAGETVAF
jgi:hypothetical protein